MVLMDVPEFEQAVACHRAGDLGRAKQLYQRCLKLAPKHLEARRHLALLFLQSDQPAAALKELNRALRIRKDWTPALMEKGRALAMVGRFTDAAAAFTRVTEISPRETEAFCFLGRARIEMGRYQEAENSLKQALAIDPAHVESLTVLATLHGKGGRHESAEAGWRKALSVAGESAALLSNLGISVKLQGRLDEAIDLYTRASELSDRDPETINNLGAALKAAGRLDEAADAFRHACALMGDFAKAHHNLGDVLLARGRFAEGWAELKWDVNEEQDEVRSRSSSRPEWSGGPAGDGKIWLWRQHGVGDEILFAGLIPEIVDGEAGGGNDCLLECDPRLAPLFERSFPNVEIAPYAARPDRRLSRPDIAAQCRLPRLGGILRPSFDHFGGAAAYLKADPARVATLKQRYRTLGSGPVIGLSWFSKAGYNSELKSTSLMDWDSVLGLPGAVFVNLQYGECAAEIAAAEAKFNVRIYQDPDIDPLDDLDGFAAQVAAMDAVLSTSNTTVHMAGALGTPVWCVLPPAGQSIWYWFLERGDSPWYGSLRLVRQSPGEPWRETIGRAARMVRLSDGMAWPGAQ
jgi:Flp pilus assembly protein TadD